METCELSISAWAGYYLLADAAAMVGISPDTAKHRLAAHPDVPRVRVGRYLAVRPADLKKCVESKQNHGNHHV